MIERTKVEGRDALVAYMDRDWNPVDDKDDAEMIKIIFDDGEIRFGVPSPPRDEDDDEDEDDEEDDDEE